MDGDGGADGQIGSAGLVGSQGWCADPMEQAWRVATGSAGGRACGCRAVLWARARRAADTAADTAFGHGDAQSGAVPDGATVNYSTHCAFSEQHQAGGTNRRADEREEEEEQSGDAV